MLSLTARVAASSRITVIKIVAMLTYFLLYTEAHLIILATRITMMSATTMYDNAK